jgi:hypothetical protein
VAETTPRRPFLREHAGVLAAAALAIAWSFAEPAMMGLPVVLGLAWIAGWGLVAAVVAWRRPPRRRPLAHKAGLWIAAAVAVGAIGGWHAERARRDADAAMAAVLAYRDAHGVWPPTLDAAGIPTRRDDLAPFYRPARDDPLHSTPELAYGAVESPHDVWVADFAHRRWDERHE